MVPKSRPMSQVASPQPASSRSVSSGTRRGGEVEVGVRPPEHRVAHRPADQRELVTGRGEHPPRSSTTGAIRPSSTSALRWSSTTVSAGGSGADTRVHSRVRARRVSGGTGSGSNLYACLAGRRSVLPWRRWRCRPGDRAARRAGACRPGRQRRATTRRPRPRLRKQQQQRPCAAAQAGGEPAGPAAPGGRGRRPARADHRPADPLDDPRQGHGPDLRDGHQQRHRDLVDDQHPPVHLGRLRSPTRPSWKRRPRCRPTRSSVTGSMTSSTSTSSRSSHRARQRPYSAQHPAPAAARLDARRLLVRRARSRRGAGGPRRDRGRPGPHLPPAGAGVPAGPAAHGRGHPAATPARLHRRRLARRPRQLDPDPLPGRPAALAGRLRGQLRQPHRHLGRRPGAHRRRTPDRGRQPAPLAGAQPAGRAGGRRGRAVR